MAEQPAGRQREDGGDHGAGHEAGMGPHLSAADADEGERHADDGPDGQEVDGAEATAAKSPDPVGGDGDDGHGDDPGPAQQPVDRRAFLADEIGRAQPERDHRENQMYPDGRHGTEPGKGEIWRQTTPVAAESRG